MSADVVEAFLAGTAAAWLVVWLIEAFVTGPAAVSRYLAPVEIALILLVSILRWRRGTRARRP
jgi:hypothetical protein